MKILMTPSVGVDGNTISYKFSGETVECTYIGLSETFDFTNLKNDEEIEVIAHILPFSPIMDVYRKDGELYLKLLHFISENAPVDDRYPDWVDVEDIIS